MGSPYDREVPDDWQDRQDEGADPQSDDERDWRLECEADDGYAEQYDDDGNPLDD